MRTMGINLNISTRRGHLWLPMATTCTQSSTTHLQCPSTPRGLQHRSQHLPSIHGAGPQGHRAPQTQVRLFGIVSGSASSWDLLFPHMLSLTLRWQQEQSFLSAFHSVADQSRGTGLTSLWQGETLLSPWLWCSTTVCLFSSTGLLVHVYYSCLCAFGCVVLNQ